MSESISRTFAIGDVHGCSVALDSLLDRISPQAVDTVVFLGDLVDRGPETKRVIERVLQLRGQCNVVSILGNHEEMMRGALEGTYMLAQWLHFGGQATLESYGDISEIPQDHLRFIFSGAQFYETETHLFIHASLEHGVSMANQQREYLRWKHLGGSERPHPSGKQVICGHTAQRDGRPMVMEGWICLDTFAYGGGWLSAMHIEDNYVYQANQDGDFRDFQLGEDIEHV